jgi:hypothetical protein
MERNLIMSFPSPHLSRIAASQSLRQATGSPPRSTTFHPLPIEGEHQLEKLQFALAIALTRGDALRSTQLREEIAQLGGNREEPGT